MQFELFEKPMSVNYFHIEGEKSYDYFLIVYITKLQIQSKFWFKSDACVFTPPKYIDKFHAIKTKDLVGSNQTLLFSSQSKVRIL